MAASRSFSESAPVNPRKPNEIELAPSLCEGYPSEGWGIHGKEFGKLNSRQVVTWCGFWMVVGLLVWFFEVQQEAFCEVTAMTWTMFALMSRRGSDCGGPPERGPRHTRNTSASRRATPTRRA